MRRSATTRYYRDLRGCCPFTSDLPARAEATLLLFVIIACSANPGPGGAPDAADSGSPGDSDPTGPSPAWSAEQAMAAMGSLSELPMAGAVIEAYLAAMAFGDAVGGCPGSPTQMAGITYTGCTADSGVLYWGIADYRDESSVEGETTWTRTGLGADFEIVFTDGESYQAGGSAGVAYESAPGRVAVWHSEVNGTWRDTSRDGALGEGVSSSLYASATEDGATVVLEGGVGMGGLAVAFGDVVFGPECGGEPTGTFQVRDPVGYWYTLDFGEECGPCGQLWFGQEALGETCVDLRGLAGLVLEGFGV